MNIKQVGAQLYTCRDSLRTAPEIAETLGRLREIGYTAVQASSIEAVSYREFGRILAETGMVCCATHEAPDQILNSPETVVERLGELGCGIAAYPYPSGIDFFKREIVEAWIAKLQRAAEVLARAGQVLCYHNHNHEFRKLDGRVILDLIYDGAPALKGEPDTYWIQYGGGDPARWCRKLAGRMPVIHLKDYQTTPDNAPTWCELGEGTLDFKGIVAAAEEGGCEWYVVEQDTCPGDPVESLGRSFRYLRENLAD